MLLLNYFLLEIIMTRYSNTQLIQILQKAARRINRELSLFGTSNEITVNNAGDMTPSDGALYDLVLMQAECMISSTDYSNELSDGGTGIMSKDGEQVLDTRGSAVARGTFFDSPHSPCKELEKALVSYKLNNMQGRLIY